MKDYIFDVNGPLREIIQVNGKAEQFNLYRFDFSNNIAEMISQEQVPDIIIQELDKNGSLNDTYYVIERGDIRGSQNPLVRVHSTCFFGDTLKHIICDCGDQYQTALEKIIEEGVGLLIYCASQDGRGIGSKLHFQSYLIQQTQGLDTFASYREMNIPEDPRNYSDVIKILKYYDLNNIRLLTNNPDKINPLEESGIKVRRIPIWTEETEINRKQLEAKLRRGHLR